MQTRRVPCIGGPHDGDIIEIEWPIVGRRVYFPIQPADGPCPEMMEIAFSEIYTYDSATDRFYHSSMRRGLKQ